jgi:hypothetical protein
MLEKIKQIWPEVEWIQNDEIKEKVYKCWEYAFDNSPLEPEDLEKIPFSLLIDDSNITFMNHKRTAVQLSVKIAEILEKNFGLKINWDHLIAGAILIDIGKLLEYEVKDGDLGTSRDGKLLRHPFSGVSIADRFNLPVDIQHIIAYHSKEGDLGKRSLESIIVHHADFVSFEPFQESKRINV